MEDLNIIKDVIGDAVKNSSYLTAVIIGLIFVIYHFINKYTEASKEKAKSKPISDMANSINLINDNVSKLAMVLNKWINDAEKKEISRISNIITVGLNSFRASILESCITTITFNSIRENETAIRQNLSKVVNTEYYKLYSILSNYEHESVNVSAKMNKDWIDEITSACLDIIYNDQDALSRVRQIDNKLNLMTGNYSVYLNNIVFNH